MTPQEFAKAMTFLGLAYDKEFSKDQLNVWYTFFSDDTDANFRKAVTRLVSKSKFLPSIAEIKSEIAGITNPELLLDPNREWANVEEAIHRYGFYNSEEAVASLDPFTAQVVRNMGGFRKICMSEDGDWTRKNFLRVWEEMKDGNKSALVLNENVMTLPELQRMAELKTEEMKLLGD